MTHLKNLVEHPMRSVTFVITLFCIGIISCKKLVEIPPPVSTLTTSQVFGDSSDATSAIAGIYNDMINTQTSLNFGNGLITLMTGLSGDELIDLANRYPPVDDNSLTVRSGITDNLWEATYTYMYSINTCIEQLKNATSISTSVRNQLTGEAMFLRAFCYFYLVNLYGDVPLVLTSNYQTNQSASRTPQATVYQQMVKDLLDAQNLLRTDYSISGGQRVRANQAAASALLARVYLYTGDYNDAATTSTAVINNPLFSLVSNPDSVFLANSQEAILQWQLNGTVSPYNATQEGYAFVPFNNSRPTYYPLNSLLLSAFEPGDRRYACWVDSTQWAGTNHWYAYKYKIGPGQAAPSAPLTEYYMVLRLAEQFLIRAEAEAMGASGGTTAAIADLNTIRSRAQLPALPATLSKTQVLAAVAQERRIELFAEWGHRWFDLKRTGAIDSVMTIATPLKSGGVSWQSYQQVYPVPLSEITYDPNIVQNPQY